MITCYSCNKAISYRSLSDLCLDCLFAQLKKGGLKQ
jgi:NMD protein affecting ribosome stability and mRNA decay